MKGFSLILLLTLTLVLSSNPVQAKKEELNLLIWCDHADPNLLRPFEEKYNVKINFKEYVVS